MKKVMVTCCLAVLLAACDGSGTINTSTIDSAGDKLQRSVESTVDTAIEKLDRWKDSLEHRHDTLP